MDGTSMNRRLFLGLTILATLPGCGGVVDTECFYFGKDSPGFASLNSKEPGGKWCTI